jgi:hypothetical protein
MIPLLPRAVGRSNLKWRRCFGITRIECRNRRVPRTLDGQLGAIDLCLLDRSRDGYDQRHDENRAFPKLPGKPTPADKPTGHRRPVELE